MELRQYDGKTGKGGNFGHLQAVSRHLRTAQIIPQPQKLHSQLVGLVTVIMYRGAGLTCSFVYGVGLQPAGDIHNDLDGDAHHLLFSHVRPTNQPTKKRVYLSYKMFGRPWFIETCVIRYQTFVSVHKAYLYSEWYKIKAATKHMQITAFSLRIYSTLKFTDVIEYDSRPHNNTQTE